MPLYYCDNDGCSNFHTNPVSFLGKLAFSPSCSVCNKWLAERIELSEGCPSGVKTTRPAWAGPVVAHAWIYSSNYYTSSVEGVVVPTTTRGRKSAPLPLGADEDDLLYSGADKGHLMALEMGGPDEPANILAQWREWQQNGKWRQQERAIVAEAEKWSALTKDKSWKPLSAPTQGRVLVYRVRAQPVRFTSRGLLNPGQYEVTLKYLEGTTVNQTKTLSIDTEQSEKGTDKRLDAVERKLEKS